MRSLKINDASYTTREMVLTCNYKASHSSIPVNLDTTFDRFRQHEISLGFASTGYQHNPDVSSELWELNDIVDSSNESFSGIAIHLSVRLKNGYPPFRPLCAVWELSLPIDVLNTVNSLSVSSPGQSWESTSQYSVTPDLYAREARSTYTLATATHREKILANLSSTLTALTPLRNAHIDWFKGSAQISHCETSVENIRPSLVPHLLEQFFTPELNKDDWGAKISLPG